MSAAILDARLLAEAESDKKRTDGKMWNMPEEHFVAIVEWLLGGIMPAKIVRLCAEELKLPPTKIPSVTRLYAFWSDFKPFYLIARRRLSGSNARALREEIERSPLNLSEATLDEIQGWAFEIAQDRDGNTKPVKALMAILQKDAELKLASRRVSVSERKLDQLKGTLSDESLSSEQKERRMKQVFGIA